MSSEAECEKEIAIAWRNLTYEVSDVRQFFYTKKKILQNLFGHFDYYSLNGLMGPSGSGKTTLLNSLSGNVRAGLCPKSEICFNMNDESLKTCFIEQNCHLCITNRLTVFELLNYAFKFKNGIHFSADDIEKHILKILKELMLPIRLKNQPYEKCSGGEKKRIAIAQELMSLDKPSLLFVDEPTTGLDSFAALEMAKCLKQLTTENRIAVIASIHQPNSETLNLFDNLYCLAKGGVCIYSGAPNLIVENLGYKLKFSQKQPPIDTVMNIACNGVTDDTVVEFANFTLSKENKQIQNRMKDLKPESSNFAMKKRKLFLFMDFYIQITRLFHITFVANFHIFLLTHLILLVNFLLVASIFSSSAVGSSCYLVDENASVSCADSFEQEIYYKENLFNIAYTLLYVGLIIAYSTTSAFTTSVRFFRNEHRNNWYSLGVFYWSSMIVNTFEITIYGIVVSFLGYFLSYQYTADDVINWNRFWYYAFFMWLLCIYVQNFTELFGVILVDHLDLSIILTLVYYCFVSMANGIYVNLDRNKNHLIVYGTNFVALKFISKGILYAIYGLGRCNPETEYSTILLFFTVDGRDLQYYVFWVLLNTLLFRMATFVLLYLRFGTLEYNIAKHLFSRHKIQEIKNANNNSSITIEFENNSKFTSDQVEKNFYMTNKEIQTQSKFHRFSTNKIIIGWRDLSLSQPKSIFDYCFKRKIKPRKILKNLNGQFCFGTLNALMGPSGAGKTSLLKTLNGQCNDRLSKETRLYYTKFTTIQTCFITQDVSDHLLPGLTVKQLLTYASKLKNGNYNEQNIKVEHEKIISTLLEELALSDTIDTKVENCSGGERKRIALALELVSLKMPNMIFIDEPTSGLDSNCAEMVISCLRQFVDRHNVTIVASIHQPNIGILTKFDNLYVLATGGTCIFSGAPMKISDTLSLVSEFNFPYPIERLISLSSDSQVAQCTKNLTQIHNSRVVSKDENLLSETRLLEVGVVQNRKRFLVHSVVVLLERNYIYFINHEWKMVAFYAVNYFLYGLFLKLFYDFKMVNVTGCLDLHDNFDYSCSRTNDAIEEIFALNENTKYTFFFSAIYMLFIYSQSALNLRSELELFYNEHRNGWYSTGSYYLMKTLSEVIITVPITLIYVFICCYYYENIRPGIYWQLALILLLSIIGLQGMSHIFTIISKGNFYLQSILALSVVLFSILLGNVYLPHYKLHYIYQFMSNFSIIRFCYESMMILQYGFGRCNSNEIQAVLYMMQLDDDNFVHCVGMLIFNMILYRVAFLYFLVKKVKSVKNKHLHKKKMANQINDFRMMKINTIIPGVSSSHELYIKTVE